MIDGLRLAKPAFLASVTDADEAEAAIAGGADIIDCKNPVSGALGALSADTVREIVKHVGGRLPVSATVGDLPSDADVLVPAAVDMASTGVDVVKVGFFDEAGSTEAITALGGADLGVAKLVAVLMADMKPDFGLLPKLAAAGFAGAMLDTANKTAGGLTSVLSIARLREFVRLARHNNLFVGLAGSLKESDIPRLVDLEPDMLGFRGALCLGGRTSALERGRVAAVRVALDLARLERMRETSVA